MIPGDRIRHPAFGAGVVLAVLARGRVPGARVDFGYMVDWVPQKELAPAGNLQRPGPEDKVSRRARERWKPLDTLTESVVGARRAVLALKLGQVLQENVLDLSVGAETAEALLRKGRRRRSSPEAGWHPRQRAVRRREDPSTDHAGVPGGPRGARHGVGAAGW